MRHIKPFALFLMSGFLLVGCVTPIQDATDSSMSTRSLSSSFVFSIPPESSRDQGVTLEAFQDSVKTKSIKNYSKVRITYTAREEVIGTVPVQSYNLAGNEGIHEYNLVIELNNFTGHTGHSKVISGEVPSHLGYLCQAPTIFVSDWLSYQAQRRNASKNAREGEGFKEDFHLSPSKTWMKLWSNRGQNMSVDGDFYQSEELERVFDDSGYTSEIRLNDYAIIKGNYTHSMEPTVYLEGSYSLSVVGQVEYID